MAKKWKLAPHYTKEQLKEQKVGGLQKTIIELQLGKREPKNDEERELLKEIREGEKKGWTLTMELE